MGEESRDGARLKVGVLTPHEAAGAEVELPEMAGIDVVVARALWSPETRSASAASHLRSLATPAVLQPAVARMCEGSVDVIAYASTTSAYAIGHTAEGELAERLGRMSDVPIVTTGIATTQALAAFGVRRLAVIHPPWFDEEMSDLAAAYFRGRGFDVTVSTATSLPKAPARVRAEQVIDWVSSQVGASTDAIFLAGNGFRAVQAIETLEHLTGQLVLEANQVLLYAVLAATRATLRVDGYGRLLRLPV